MSEPAAAHAVRWERLLVPALVVYGVLLVLPQGWFIWKSVHADVGMGRISQYLTFDNYLRILTDPFYLHALWLTTYLSLIATAIGLVVAFPTAYQLARMRSGLVSYLIALLLISSFVTVLIKILGLIVVLSQSGIINKALMAIGLVERPVQMLSNETGVVIGLVQYILPLYVMLLFSVIQTIPRSLEDAAEIHGAGRVSTFVRVVLPLARPGIVASSFIAFNMCMGAFTSAVLLGGGRVLTLPVLIQQKITFDVQYGFGSALSTFLLVVVFAINLAASAVLATRLGRRRFAAQGAAA